MTHQNLSLGKCWKLFRVTSNRNHDSWQFCHGKKLLPHSIEFTTTSNPYLQLHQIHLWSLLPTTSTILVAATKTFDSATLYLPLLTY